MAVEFNAVLESELGLYFEQQLVDFGRLDPRSVRIVEYVLEVAGSGGKRVRPLLCYLGHIASGAGHSTSIIRVAASIELLHTFAIIHDDIMDASDSRRGKPSLHRLIEAEVGDENLGISLALLAGDLAFSFSKHLFDTSGFPSELMDNARPYVREMERNLAAGQYLDLISDPMGGTDALMRASRLKTASYTAQGPLLVGAALAGANDETRLSMSEYGLAIGEAFQLHDDVEGMSSGTERMISNVALAEALSLDPALRPLYDRLIAGDDSVREQLRERFSRSGAAERIKSLIRQCSLRALDSLKKFPELSSLEQRRAVQVLVELIPLLTGT